MTSIPSFKIPPQALSPKPSAARPRVDLSRGASCFGIRARVYIESKILEEYGEIDKALGHNTAGLVLSALERHLASGKASLAHDMLTVCVVRRQDDALVDLDLSLSRTRVSGQECFSLRLADEREAENSFDRHQREMQQGFALLSDHS